MTETNNAVELVELAADIVAAYVGNNAVSAEELTALIGDVHKALVGVASGVVAKPVEALVPAVSIKKSVQNDFIICLEDGKKFKSAKRHLRTKYDLSPEDYRAKWGLSADYPMVAPSYAEARSNLAKASGLGQQRRKTPPKGEPKRGRKAAGN